MNASKSVGENPTMAIGIRAITELWEAADVGLRLAGIHMWLSASHHRIVISADRVSNSSGCCPPKAVRHGTGASLRVQMTPRPLPTRGPFPLGRPRDGMPQPAFWKTRLITGGRKATPLRHRASDIAQATDMVASPRGSVAIPYIVAMTIAKVA